MTGFGDSALYSLPASAFGRGPGLAGMRRRPLSCSTVASKDAAPTGRPICSALRNRVLSASSSPAETRLARSGKRAGTAATAVRPSSSMRPRRARTLHQRQSTALSARGAHLVHRHMDERGRQMVVVHRNATEPTLPEASGALLPRVDISGVAAVRARQGAAKAVFIRRNQDQMNVIGRQDPAPRLDLGLRAVFGQKVPVERIVAIAEERRGAAVSTLGHMVGKPWKDGARQLGALSPRHTVAKFLNKLDLTRLHLTVCSQRE